ncbi:hypothetical protein sos41_13720 [Alphaproteobacteria bacterium SO-S41]|nr:hypothetical protein sos41_13720 [Alphaproteobacteria bacterium SO-S41]
MAALEAAIQKTGRDVGWMAGSSPAMTGWLWANVTSGLGPGDMHTTAEAMGLAGAA